MSRADDPTVADALRALAAPGSVLALVVLVLNDHVLKQAWPGWVTGKLSDVAGLVLAPLLLAVLLAAARVPRPSAWALASTGAGFVLCKTTATGAALTSSVWSLFGTSTLIRSDVTDLVALPALGLAWWTHRTTLARSRAGRRRTAAVALGMAVLPVGVLATSATSPCEEPAGYEEVGVLHGDFPGAPDEAEQRLAAARVGLWFTVDHEGEFLEHTYHPHAGRLNRGTEACVGTRCWRLFGDDAVHATDARGTLVLEARLSQDDRDEIAADAGTEDSCNDGPPEVGATDIAALGTDRGPLVLVSLQHGGVWFRQHDGTWTVLTETELDALVGDAPSSEPPAVREIDAPDDEVPPEPSTPTATCPTPSVNPTTRPSNGPQTPYDECAGRS